LLSNPDVVLAVDLAENAQLVVVAAVAAAGINGIWRFRSRSRRRSRGLL
jgi:hypothetical protein